MAGYYTAGAALLAGVLLFAALLAASMLWRLGLKAIPPVELLRTVEGLPLGSRAPDLGVHAGSDEFHLQFRDRWTFLAFGNESCGVCAELIRATSNHPATHKMRLIYVSNADPKAFGATSGAFAMFGRVRWEAYRFDTESQMRTVWHVPVVPYFHVIDPQGRVAAKGTATRLSHLDHLLGLGINHTSSLFEEIA